MPFTSIRRPPIAIFLTGLTLAAAMIMLKIDREVGYVARNLISGAWGEGAEAFGRGRGPDGRESGPRSFALDPDGRIYVSDTFNQRVKVYDQEGRLLRQFPVGEGLPRKPFIEDLAVTRAGHIYLADNAGGGLLKYDGDGHLLAVLAVRPDLRPGDLWRVEALAPGPDDGVHVLGMVLTPEGYTGTIQAFSATGALRSTPVEVRLDVTGRPLKQSPGSVEGLIGGFVRAGDGRLVLIAAGETPFQRRLISVPAGGGSTDQWIYDSSAYIEEASLLGVDASGHTYLGVNLSTRGGLVARLSPAGEVEESIPAGVSDPVRPGPTLLMNARVDAAGRIYLARSTAERFEIVRLEPRWRLGLQPRWRHVARPR